MRRVSQAAFRRRAQSERHSTCIQRHTHCFRAMFLRARGITMMEAQCNRVRQGMGDNVDKSCFGFRERQCERR